MYLTEPLTLTPVRYLLVRGYYIYLRLIPPSVSNLARQVLSIPLPPSSKFSFPVPPPMGEGFKKN